MWAVIWVNSLNSHKNLICLCLTWSDSTWGKIWKMTGKREDLKLEWVFETLESTPFLSSSLYFSSQRRNKVKDTSSHVAYIGDRAGNFQSLWCSFHPRTIFLWSANSYLEGTVFCTPHIGWEKQCLLYKSSWNYFSHNQINRTPKCLPARFPQVPFARIFFSLFLWKATSLLHLGITNLTCSDSAVQTSIA